MKENKVIIYTTNDGKTKIDVKLEEETLWLTQAQMCELYQTSKSNVSEHIKHIFAEEELTKEATVRKFRIVQMEGSRNVEREVEHYNLDMIIALGYRIRSIILIILITMKTVKLSSFILGILLTACSGSQEKTTTLPSINLRDGLNKTEVTTLANEIKGVSYVPLEMTDDDASVIDGVANFAVSDKYIYVLPAKEMRIVLFGRDGKFIRNLINSGQGPEEFIGSICSMQFDRKTNRLYLFDVQDVWIYTAEGEFIEKRHYDFMSLLTYNLSEKELGAISFPFTPFDQGSFGMGIFTNKGDTVAIENKMFYSSLVAKEKSGFTMDIAASYSEYPSSMLFKCGSNDTIYRIKSNGIEPSFVVKLDNSDKQIARSLDITDFAGMRNLEDENDIAITDMMETEKTLYLRFRYQHTNHVASINKENGTMKVEKCHQPKDFMTMARANLLQGMSGTQSYKNFPVWGRVENKELIQVITPYELSLYANEPITIPTELKNIKEDENPIFVFYKL